jgi:hypothetical protein
MWCISGSPFGQWNEDNEKKRETIIGKCRGTDSPSSMQTLYLKYWQIGDIVTMKVSKPGDLRVEGKAP